MTTFGDSFKAGIKFYWEWKKEHIGYTSKDAVEWLLGLGEVQPLRDIDRGYLSALLSDPDRNPHD